MHVKQLELQVLQILLSEISPNSFEFVQLVPHSHVPLFPKRGLGQASTHEESDLYRGESHVKQFVAAVWHVLQVASQGLQILLLAASPNSLELGQELEQVLVLFIPQLGMGHAITHVVSDR